jgi:hypothetical protein
LLAILLLGCRVSNRDYSRKIWCNLILLSWNWNFDSRIFAYATFVKDTRHFVHKEAISSAVNQKKLNNVFIETTFKNKTLSAVTQAGLVNNLNDGMIWGLLPIILFTMHYNTANIGIITAYILRFGNWSIVYR